MTRQSSDMLKMPALKIMRTPRSVDVEITSRCNLRCRYCYYYDNPAVQYHELSAEEWLKFFDELGRCAVMEVTVQGGEPFIRKDLTELLAGIVRNRMRFSILSNGTLINDDTAAYIASTGRCDLVQVSVDGSSPENHDVFRGKGSFVKAIQGIETLQRHGVPVSARVTIHRRNVGDLKNVARFLLDDLGLPGFSTNSVDYMGSCRVDANDVLLTVEDRQEAMRALLDLDDEYDGRISATAGPLADAKGWRKMEEAMLQKDPPWTGGGHLTGCGCFFAKLNVRADGMITPCCMLTHLELGRINRDSLKDVWLNNHILGNMRLRQDISLAGFEFCRDCPYLPYCTGDCPGTGFSLTREVDHPNPDSCLRKFLADGGKIP